MTITSEQIVITVNNMECLLLCSSLKVAIEHTIHTHWKNFDEETFNKNEYQRLNLLRELSRMCGYGFMEYDKELRDLLKSLIKP